MAKITIELDDTLQDRVDSACHDVLALLKNYLDENTPRTCPDLNDLDDAGDVHEIIDGAVPIYTRDIETAWYLHSSALEAAYENAGVGDNPRENNGMAAIYFYLQEAVGEWYGDNAEDIFAEWQEARDAANGDTND